MHFAALLRLGTSGVKGRALHGIRIKRSGFQSYPVHSVLGQDATLTGPLPTQVCINGYWEI